jgi:hypothetical protein
VVKRPYDEYQKRLYNHPSDLSDLNANRITKHLSSALLAAPDLWNDVQHRLDSRGKKLVLADRVSVFSYDASSLIKQISLLVVQFKTIPLSDSYSCSALKVGLLTNLFL